jgi:hypothetical protein
MGSPDHATRAEALAADWPDHLPLIDTLRAQYAHRPATSTIGGLAVTAGAYTNGAQTTINVATVISVE